MSIKDSVFFLANFLCVWSSFCFLCSVSLNHREMQNMKWGNLLKVAKIKWEDIHLYREEVGKGKCCSNYNTYWYYFLSFLPLFNSYSLKRKNVELKSYSSYCITHTSNLQKWWSGIFLNCFIKITSICSE